ncbi:MAG: flagellar biosynthetic protein FliQ [Candidatus Eiseniibacteriota bacterium]
MSISLAVELIRRAVFLALMVGSPLMLTALVVGVLVSLVQAVTQLQEQTLTFLPKLGLIALVFIIALPWMLSQMVAYLTGIMRGLSTLAL